MLSPRIFALCSLAVVTTLCCPPAGAQISSLNFESLEYNGTATQTTNGNDQQVLRLTQDVGSQDGSAWYTTQQSVANGFTTVFQFQITHNPELGVPADGIAFVVQNSTNECDGGGLCALGDGGGGMGYQGINNSLAIEFDTYQNGYDPNANHIAVQSCGTGNNTADHTSCELGIAPMLGLNLADGNVHTVVLQYDPGSDGPGTLSIFIDNVGAPILTVPLQLDTLLNLNVQEDGTETAYVGFTGATGAASETGDILSWTFTPGGTTAPTPITQTLTPGPGTHTTNYVFGSYNHKYQYTGAQGGDDVTVTAIPSDPATIDGYLQTSFPTAHCIRYDGTGGECVLFHVTCAATGNDCTNLSYTLFDSYNTEQTINAPCLLKTEDATYPLGWVNIETAFSQTRFDPTHTGNSTGFSYVVAAQNCAPPAKSASGLNGHNCNGVYTGTFRGNLTVSKNQSCTLTNGSVIGNLTQTGGTVVLEGISSVNGNLNSSGGNLSLSNTIVGNNVLISGAGTFLIGPGVTIRTNLLMQNLTAGPGSDQVCGTEILGKVTLQNSAAAVQIGAESGCPGNTVGGAVLVQNNSAPTQIFSNQVGGNLNDQSNTALTRIYSNTVKGNLTNQNNTGGSEVYNNIVTKKLQCSGDTSITGGGNTASSKTGQCSAF